VSTDSQKNITRTPLAGRRGGARYLAGKEQIRRGYGVSTVFSIVDLSESEI